MAVHMSCMTTQLLHARGATLSLVFWLSFFIVLLLAMVLGTALGNWRSIRKAMQKAGLPWLGVEPLQRISRLRRLVCLSSAPWIQIPCPVHSLHLLAEPSNGNGDGVWDRNHLLRISSELLPEVQHPYVEGIRHWLSAVGSDPRYVTGIETLQAGNDPQEPLVLESLPWQRQLPLTSAGRNRTDFYQIGFPDLLLPGLSLSISEQSTPCMALLKNSRPAAIIQWSRTYNPAVLQAAKRAHEAGLEFALILPEPHGPVALLAEELNHCAFFPGCDSEAAARHLQRLVLEAGFPRRSSRKFRSPIGRVARWDDGDWDLPTLQWEVISAKEIEPNLKRFLELYCFSRECKRLLGWARIAERILNLFH